MKLRKITPKNKRGEFGISAFFVVAISLFILAPIVLKVINSSTDGFFNAMNSTSPTAVAEGVNAVGKVTNLFDYLVVIGFLIFVLLLFISSFFIDTSPVFVLVYIMSAFILMLIGPNLADVVQTIWGKFPTETGQLPFTAFLLDNIMLVLIGLIILTGIIMYSKFRSNTNDW